MKTDRLSSLADPVLGTLVLESDDHLWCETRLELGGRPITFLIGGDQEPSPGLLQHARDIVAAWPEFEARVAAFLLREADVHSRDSSEIRALRIDSIELWWQDRPDDGMIYFTGSSERRLWRCDYIGRQPRDLGFDS